MNRDARALLIILAASALVPASYAQDEVPSAEPSILRWDPGTLRLFATLPVQDGGRIKPLDTFANYELLKFRGRRSCKNLEGETISGLEWFLDTLLFPEQAKQYEVFLVENSEALDAVGLTYEKKRDRYSYKELEPVIPALFDLARQYAHIEPKNRNLVQTQIANLTNNIREFELLTSLLAFANTTFPIGDSSILAELFPGKSEITLSEFLAQAHSLRGKLIEIRENAELDDEEPAAVEVFAEEPDGDDSEPPLSRDNRDDLKMIKGVGPAIEKTLNEMGIFRFRQIADMSEYEIDRVARRPHILPPPPWSYRE